MTLAELVWLHSDPNHLPTARDSVTRVAPIAAALLAAWGVDFTMVGSCALVLHGVATDCNDLDIVPDLAPANIRRLHDALSRFATLPVPSVRSLATQSVSTVHGPYGRVDVMGESARGVRRADCPGIGVWVAGVEVRIAAIDDVVRLRACDKEAAE